jgi:hypothetical protein
MLPPDTAEAHSERSRRTARTPSQYVTQGPRTVVAKPTVSSFTPAMQVYGMTRPKPMTTVGTTKPKSGVK